MKISMIRATGLEIGKVLQVCMILKCFVTYMGQLLKIWMFAGTAIFMIFKIINRFVTCIIFFTRIAFIWIILVVAIIVIEYFFIFVGKRRISNNNFFFIYILLDRVKWPEYNRNTLPCCALPQWRPNCIESATNTTSWSKAEWEFILHNRCMNKKIKQVNKRTKTDSDFQQSEIT